MCFHMEFMCANHLLWGIHLYRTRFTKLDINKKNIKIDINDSASRIRKFVEDADVDANIIYLLGIIDKYCYGLT